MIEFASKVLPQRITCRTHNEDTFYLGTLMLLQFTDVPWDKRLVVDTLRLDDLIKFSLSRIMF